MKNQNKTKITVGSVVKSKVGDLEKNTREVRISRTRKELLGGVQDVFGNKNLLVQLKYGQKKDISYYSLVFLSLKEEVEIDDPL